MSWGFDPELVNEWLSDTATSWEELSREQQIAEARKAMGDIQVATDYLQSIADNMMEGIREMNQAHRDAIIEMNDAHRAAFQEAMDGRIADIRA